MLRVVKYFVFVVSVFAMVSCSTVKLDERYNAIDVKVPINESHDSIKLSKYFKSVTFLPLETKSECLIGDISKIRVSKDKIYILDRKSNSLLVFDMTGKFIRKVSRVGGGPGEYITLIDFDLEGDDLYLLDLSSQKILHFKGFDFQSSSNINFMSNEFCVAGDRLIFRNLSFKPQFNHYIICSMDGKVESEILPQKDKSLGDIKSDWASDSEFAKCSSKLYFSPYFSDSIFEYDVKGHDIANVHVLDFGSKRFPSGENINDYNISELKFPYMVRHSLMVERNYLIYSYHYKGERYFDWYNTLDKTHDHGIASNDINNIPFLPKWSFDNGLVGFIDTFLLFDSAKVLRNSHKELSNLKGDDNPVLIIYRYKKIRN